MVKIQGWLFYDFSHKTENYAEDPDDNIGRPNWRATGWEIHPITAIEVLDPIEANAGDMDAGGNYVGMVSLAAATPTQPTPNTNINTSAMQQTPTDFLVIVLLAALLGMAGQGIRVIAGLKKMQEIAGGSNANFDSHQLFISLFISLIIGVVAGILAAIMVNGPISKATYFGFIAAGYAGTDFIEAFMRKNSPTTPPPVTPVNTNPQPPVGGGI
jgi:hypothetical protein